MSLDTPSVGRSSLVMASGTIVSRILGFIRAVMLAATIGVTTDAADAFDKQYRSRTFAMAILGSKALAMWRGKIPGSLDIANESCDDSGHYNVRGFFVIAMHSPPKSPKRLKTLQRAMEFEPDDFIIDSYRTEARLQNNVSAELDALAAAVDASYYPGARRERAKKAFINAVKTHHITGKAAILAEKYASESKPTH